jgi:signal peptidase I
MGWVVAGSLVFVATVVATVVAARRWLVLVRVTGTSMLPTYCPGDRVLIRRTAGSSLMRDQVVVLEPRRRGRWGTGPLPEPASAEWLIKRIAALPGDSVPVACAGIAEGEIVPPGMLIVLGDGERSTDSRVWGFVPVDRVLGRVVHHRAVGASSAS